MKMADPQRKSNPLKDKLLITSDLETGKRTPLSICRGRKLPKSAIATISAIFLKLICCSISLRTNPMKRGWITFNILH